MASGLPKGSPERKAILAGLGKKSPVDGLAAAKDYWKDYPSKSEPRLVQIRADIQGKAQWTTDMWPSGKPVTKMFGRNPQKTVSLSGVFYGVAYLGLSSGAQMVELFDEETQTWYSFKGPKARALLQNSTEVAS